MVHYECEWKPDGDGVLLWCPPQRTLDIAFSWKPQSTQRSIVVLISVPRVHGTEINATTCSNNIYRGDFCQGVSAGFVFQVLRKYKSRILFTESASPLCVLCGLSGAGVKIPLISTTLDASTLPSLNSYHNTVSVAVPSDLSSNDTGTVNKVRSCENFIAAPFRVTDLTLTDAGRWNQ